MYPSAIADLTVPVMPIMSAAIRTEYRRWLRQTSKKKYQTLKGFVTGLNA
jgi:hypothetical protein